MLNTMLQGFTWRTMIFICDNLNLWSADSEAIEAPLQARNSRCWLANGS